MIDHRARFSRLKFKTKVTLGIAAILVVFGILLGALLSGIAADSLREENRKRGVAITVNLAKRVTESLLASDFLRMKTLVDEIREHSDNVMYAFVCDSAGHVLVHTFQGGFPTDLLSIPTEKNSGSVQIHVVRTTQGMAYDFTAPVLIDGKDIGQVRLGLSWAQINQAVRRLVAISFASTFAVVLVGMGLGSWFAGTITRRIGKLRDSADDVIKGQLNTQTGPILAQNCWELMNCKLTQCPAHGDVRRRCWLMVGTGTRAEDRIACTEDSCSTCPVYRCHAGDELQDLAEAFDVMAVALESHILEISASQKTMAQQKQILRTILDVTPDFVALQDRELRYLAANKAFCQYFEVTEENILGKTDFDIFSERQADLNYHEDRQILQTGVSLSKEIRVSGKKGVRWFHVVKVPVYDGSEISGLLLTARDVTVVKQYQEQLIHSQKMEDLGRLAGGVAHEINTPLGIILGYAQLLIEDVPEGSQIREDLLTIEKQARVCKKIVADLLGFSRSTDTTKTEMELNDSIREVASLTSHTFGLSRIQVHLDLDENVPPVQGDKERLKQVWMNLMNNAADAVGGNGHIVVGTKLCAHRRRVVISVADTGQGIDEKVMGKIFDPFFTTKEVGKGTGLGLSVSFGIIKDHNGRISAQSPVPERFLEIVPFEERSDAGPGTVFLVELPLWQGKLPDEECELMAEV
ncbi:MAG: PAS domain S-box protein [Deltaproteobacteria bacterium]|nr:PAS domain S-box protein [Deltaproteobacteria bacterium]